MVPDLVISFNLPAGEKRGDPGRAPLDRAASIAFQPKAHGHRATHGCFPQHLQVRLTPFPCWSVLDTGSQMVIHLSGPGKVTSLIFILRSSISLSIQTVAHAKASLG